MFDRPSRRRIANAVGRFVRARAAVDRRALAAVRIGLGLVILIDLLLRSRHLRALYTDSGVLTTDALASAYPSLAGVSMHAVAESVAGPAGVAALFVIAGIVAVALAVGYHSRIAAAVSLAFVLSLQARNPFVLNSGDLLLWQLCLFATLLPVGSRWSIDAVRGPPVSGDRAHPGRADVQVASVATAALLVHVALVYVTNAVFKLRGDRWIAGDGAAIAFSMDQFTVLLGPWVAGSPTLLWILNYAWLGLLVASPLLVVARGRIRTAIAAGIAGGHAGMVLTMAISVFPLVSIVSLLPFLGSGVWDRIEAATAGIRYRLIAVVDGDSNGDSMATVDPGIGPWLHAAVRTIAVALLVGTLVWNAAALGYVEVGADDAGIDPTEYGWEMFAPDPSGTDHWFVINAELASGEHVDGLGRGSVTSEPPPDVDATYPSARWRKYLISITVADDPTVSRSTAAYVCRTVADRTGESVESVEITYYQRMAWPEPSEEVGTNRLVTHDCRA
ncbi:Vitamin K-dependent gamma-carboxylase [Halopenitus malekzadehii]|uniref:Vitamin K-dependent gamma-carboxylase n=1 Tax=Halopenitus malekzadehii TaxID=1267564 RepID=A0A1H6I5A2_9EURY|nr:HTTM domain-containing protein [Halopenitus malekzadehii]SEH41559.1 Vitamin K-dependent gamma-carboxylase [Halopenitus malekzadehii]